MTIESMPGFRPILGAQLPWSPPATSAPTPAPYLAAAAGLVQSPTTPADDPATCTSRAVTADSCGTSVSVAQTSMMRAGPNRAYLKKRAGVHTPAVITLARRRIGILWALLRRLHLQHRPAQPRCRGRQHH